MNVTIEALTRARRATIENLFQLYIHDFTEFWAGTNRANLGEDGLYALDADLDSYWTEPGGAPLLIRANGMIAGFALINARAHSGLPLDFNVGEFFVARKYRRQGVGAAAVQLMLQDRSGVWEAAVAERNIGAQRFWPRAIAAAGARDIEEHGGDGKRWTGPIFRFRIN